VRWIVSPALAALRSWSRRAEVTCDRAGLLCTRDVDVSAAALTKSGVGAEYVEALRVFAESEYFRAMMKQPGGMTPEACDERVAEILKGRVPDAPDGPDVPVVPDDHGEPGEPIE
jgi:hypothetical protein